MSLQLQVSQVDRVSFIRSYRLLTYHALVRQAGFSTSPTSTDGRSVYYDYERTSTPAGISPNGNSFQMALLEPNRASIGFQPCSLICRTWLIALTWDTTSQKAIAVTSIREIGCAKGAWVCGMGRESSGPAHWPLRPLCEAMALKQLSLGTLHIYARALLIGYFHGSGAGTLLWT
ncbi:hypothetical protein PCH_Pc23g00310 [Penicillium rubens Wisconsin 54-1255]|uniref:Uncharacterized protein n=1 Tax=Penicillium rubens (strain ATCC 28089 / DSM 1075 / NRRL 1951 / Wisconsin 54-1255) TaxID=500485 RepID=B6HW87_PENRW|nr:hypothetical protein PCH_Pc23g00310 [Penicillium rubens Wisconsin 54-1255]